MSKLKQFNEAEDCLDAIEEKALDDFINLLAQGSVDVDKLMDKFFGDKKSQIINSIKKFARNNYDKFTVDLTDKYIDATKEFNNPFLNKEDFSLMILLTLNNKKEHFLSELKNEITYYLKNFCEKLAANNTKDDTNVSEVYHSMPLGFFDIEKGYDLEHDW